MTRLNRAALCFLASAIAAVIFVDRYIRDDRWDGITLALVVMCVGFGVRERRRVKQQSARRTEGRRLALGHSLPFDRTGEQT